MQKLLIYQSMWAMERRRPDGLEWTLDERLRMVRDAGFDGVGLKFADRDYVRTVTGFLREAGLSWQAQCYPRTVADLLAPVLPARRAVAERGLVWLAKYGFLRLRPAAVRT